MSLKKQAVFQYSDFVVILDTKSDPIKTGGTPINIFVTGGARSGKSSYVQKIAEDSGEKVLFVATAEAYDDEMRRRIAAHQQSRPDFWTTLETSAGVGEAILSTIDDEPIVIIDCITLLINAVFNRFGEDMDYNLIETEALKEVDGLIGCMKQLDRTFYMVSNEVGLGLVPDNQAGRFYRDILGRANSRLASFCDEVYFMVSGLPLTVKPVR